MEIKLNLKIRDTEIKDLSLDEIKELRDILDKLIPVEKEYILYPDYPTTSKPTYIPNRWDRWEVTYHNTPTTHYPDTGDDIYYTVSLT